MKSVQMSILLFIPNYPRQVTNRSYILFTTKYSFKIICIYIDKGK